MKLLCPCGRIFENIFTLEYEQIVWTGKSSQANESSDVQTGRTNFSTNKSSDIWPSGKTTCPSRRTSRWQCCQTICPSRLFVRPGNAHFSSFDFTSNKLKLIFASHSDSSWSEKSLNCPPYFFVTSIQFERKPVWPVLWSSNTVWYLYSFWALFVLYEVQFNG